MKERAAQFGMHQEKLEKNELVTGEELHTVPAVAIRVRVR
jgi:hypothetical protein